MPGVLGLVWVWVWKRHFHLPEHDPALGADERALVMAERVAPAIEAAERRPLGEEMRAYFGRLAHWFRYPETWGLALARFTADGAFYFLAFWIPNYLSDVRGFGLKEIAWAAAIPFVFADLGSLVGGYAGQRRIRTGWSVDASRKTMIWAGAIGSLVAWPVALTETWVAALVLCSIATMMLQAKTASLLARP